MVELSLLIIILPLSLVLLLYLIIRPRPTRIPIKSRHVLITGGSSGIGLALAHRFVAEGARVTILARDQRKLDDAKEAIRLASGVDVTTLSADVRDFDALKNALDSVVPSIDVLVCNQGVFVARELESQPLEEVKFMLNINLMGNFHLIKAALPLMKHDRKARGPASISIISSQAGQVGIYGYTVYSATKFGLRGLAEALQQEVIADDIHVSVVFPPDTDTPGLEQENKLRSELTTIIAGSSSSMNADEVAKKTINGIKNGRFIIPCNSEGFLMSIATAGFSPQPSSVMAFIEVYAAGIARIAGLLFQWTWYRSIHKFYSKNK